MRGFIPCPSPVAYRLEASPHSGEREGSFIPFTLRSRFPASRRVTLILSARRLIEGSRTHLDESLATRVSCSRKTGAMRYKLSRHAEQELERRGISMSQLKSVLHHPQQVIPDKKNRLVYQSQVDRGDGKMVLIRVIVVERADDVLVVTVYRTTRIQKYWRQP
jgi:hypothetical protein